jgi:hypothetical protein
MRRGSIVTVLCSTCGTSVLSARAGTQFDVPITPPVALNFNAVSDSGRDFAPQVTTDGLGNWVAVWGGKKQSLRDFWAGF